MGQARSGFLALTSEEDGSPRYVGGHALADQVGAMMLAYGTVLALLARERFGIGQDVDVSQLGSMLAMQSMTFNNHLIMGADPLGASEGRPVNPVFNSNARATGSGSHSRAFSSPAIGGRSAGLSACGWRTLKRTGIIAHFEE